MRQIIQFALLWVFFLYAINIGAQNNRPATNNVQDMEIFYHTVESGQTVYSIAKLYDVMVIDIYKLNPSSEHGIKAGERLKIPQRRYEEKSILKTKNTNNDATGNAAKGNAATENAAKSATGNATKGNDATGNATKGNAATGNAVKKVNDDDNYISHTIQSGDTLYGLSRKYGVSAESILEANPGLSKATFTVGRKIRIPKYVQQKPVTKVVDNKGAKEVNYTIPAGETLYNICRTFKTTESELLKLNPEMAGGLRIGMTIRIPLNISENEFPKDTPPTPRPVVNIVPGVKLMNPIKIALLLPVDTDNSKATDMKKRYIEFYEGFLLAIDSLRKQNQEIEVFTEAIGEDNLSKTKKVLQDKATQLAGVHLIIGGHTSGQVKLIADFAKQNNKKYVIPISRNDEVADNPNVFQVNTPPAFMFEKIANAGANLFAKYNIIFLDTKDKDDQTELIKTFRKDLKDRNVSYKDAVYDADNFEENILSLLSTNKPNLIMPISPSLDALLKIKPILRLIADTKPEYKLTLFGYPLWQTYTKDCLDDFHALNTYIFSYFYADNTHPSVKMFYDNYKNWYNKSPMPSFPKYALLGFDTGMYFINTIRKYGANMEEHLSEMNYKSLQTGFNFNRANNEGSFINTNLFIIHYNTDYSITRSEFK